MTFLNPTSASQNTAASIPQGCGMLKFDANLHALTKVVVPTQGPWTVDWSHITRFGDGTAVDFGSLDSLDVIVGFYKNMTVSDLETHFFDIETLAGDNMWRIKNVPLLSHTANLSVAQNSQGALFNGFDPQDGVWAIGLQCPTCQNPAPVILAIVDTIGGDQ